MQLTKEKLTAELAGLQAKQQQALANLNLITGGLQVLEQLIAMLDKPEPEPAPAEAPAKASHD